MLTLKPQLFNELPRTDLNKHLNTSDLSTLQVTEDNQYDITIYLTNNAFIHTIRSLTLPNPTPTSLVPKSKLPDHPMSYGQLKQWREALILKLQSAPCPKDKYLMVERIQQIRLLTQMEFK